MYQLTKKLETSWYYAKICHEAIKCCASLQSRNLGVHFDAQLNMEEHITNVCKSAYHTIYNLRHIRKYADLGSTKTIVHAYITGKLDYCNGLYGLLDSQIRRLQWVQNTCARLICACSKCSRITPLSRDLHRLPVCQRILFKILLTIVYKALLGQAPTYIVELIKHKSHQHTHNLPSSQDTLLLQTPSHKIKITLGDRAFVCAAPKLWNKLPLEIRKSSSLHSFKSKLKAHLFIKLFYTSIMKHLRSSCSAVEYIFIVSVLYK